MPSGQTIGDLFVRVLPDVTQFNNRLNRAVSKAARDSSRSNTVNLKAEVDLQSLQRSINRAIRGAQRAAGAIKIKAELDETSLLRSATRAIRSLNRSGALPALKVSADIDTTGARASFDALLHRMSGETVTVRVRTNNPGLGGVGGGAGAAGGLGGLLGGAGGAAGAGVSGITGAVSSLSGAFSGLTSTMGAVQGGFSALLSTGSQVGSGLGQLAGIAGKLGGTLGEAGSAAGGIGAALGPVAIAVGALVAAVSLAIGVLGALAAASAAFIATAVIATAVITALATAASVLAGALAAIPAALGAVGAGLGAIMLVVQPLTDAWTAWTAEQNAGTEAAGKSATATLNNAKAVRAAKDAVAAARENEGRVAMSNGRSIASAERAVADAVRESRDAQLDLNKARKEAIQDFADLKEQLSDLALSEDEARLAVQRAQEALDKAKGSTKDGGLSMKEAMLDVATAQEDLSNARKNTASSALEIEQAELRLAQAQERVGKVQQAAVGSTLDVKEAELGLLRAQDNLSDTQRDRARTQAEVNKVNKDGIDSTDKVKQAVDRKRQADEKVIDTQRSLKEAQIDASLATKDAAKATSQAVANLHDAQVKQTEATEKTSAAASKLSSALDKLSPAGKSFFAVLQTMKPLLEAISKVVQESMLPNLEPLVKVIGALFGTIDKKGKLTLGPFGKILQDMGGIIGTVGKQFGTALGTIDKKGKLSLGPLGKALVNIGEAGNAMAKALGPATVTAITAIAVGMGNLAKNSGPVIDAFANGFTLIGDGLKGFFDQLNKPEVIAGMASGLNGFFKIVGGLLPIVGQLLGKFAELGGPILDKLSGPLLQIFQSISDMLVQLLQSGAMDSFVVFVQAIANGFTTLANSGVMAALGKAFSDILISLAPIVTQLVNALAPELPMLVWAFGQMSIAFIEMLPSLIKLAPVLVKLATDFIIAITPYIPQLVQGLEILAAVLSGPMLGLFATLLTVGLGALVGLSQGFEDLVLVVTIAGQVMMRVFRNLILTPFLNTVEGVLGGAEKMFGWIPGVGDKLKTAHDKFHTFRTGVDTQFDGVMTKTDDFATNLRTNMINSGKKSDTFKSKVGDLNTALGQFDGNYTANLKTSGYATLADQLNAVARAQYQLEHPNPSGNMNPNLNSGAPSVKIIDRSIGKATGGYIDGPGSKTSDSVPARLSKGEFVQQASAVDYYGKGFMTAINQRKLPKSVLAMMGAPGYAKGGIVMPFTTDLSQSYVKPMPSSGSAISASSGAWKDMWAAIHAAFPMAKLFSAFRKGSRTLSGNTSYHASGRAIDVSPIRDIADWIIQHYGSSITELIDPWPSTHRWHGKPHKYSRAINAQHGVYGNNAHIHWAMANGFAGAVGSGGGGGGAASGSAQQYAMSRLANYGWGGGQFGPLKSLWNRESNWRVHARNPSSGAYGIPQALPGSKMRSAGKDWQDNYRTQINWGLGYIKGRYGSPSGAWAHSQRTGWYDNGGWLRQGAQMTVNNTGKPEAVLTPDESAAFKAVANAFASGAGNASGPLVVMHNNVSSPENAQSLMQQAEFYVRAGRIR